MSRVGKIPIELPSGVKAEITPTSIRIEGPKGKLEQPLSRHVKVASEDGKLVVSPQGREKQALANWGTTRAIINNMVTGVTEGWTKSLDLVGVGFTANLSGDVLTLATGYSHKTDVKIPKVVSCKVVKQNIQLESCDKHAVGEMAATIRRVCPPEPYLGKGIRYTDEHVRRKAGKAGAK